jgi:hypothetical protein
VVVAVAGGLLTYSYVIDGALTITTRSELLLGALTVLPLALALFLRTRARAYAVEEQSRDTEVLAQLEAALQSSESVPHA